jgi:hypothetical protein
MCGSYQHGGVMAYYQWQSMAKAYHQWRNMHGVMA